MNRELLQRIIEGAIFVAGEPVTLERLAGMFSEHDKVDTQLLQEVLAQIEIDCESRGYELKQVATGYRFQVKADLSPWLVKLWEERPAKYSRAVLETLALIAYRQPVTRGEIEDIRGVTGSSNIVKTLLDREWIRVIGHRDVPGKPSLYATTKNFLDYFNLQSLEDLPTLAELMDIDAADEQIAEQLQLDITLVSETGEAAENEATVVENSDEVESELEPVVKLQTEGDAADESMEENAITDNMAEDDETESDEAESEIAEALTEESPAEDESEASIDEELAAEREEEIEDTLEVNFDDVEEDEPQAEQQLAETAAEIDDSDDDDISYLVQKHANTETATDDDEDFNFFVETEDGIAFFSDNEAETDAEENLEEEVEETRH